MLCDICKEQEAKVQITQIVDEVSPLQLNLCEDCAKARNVNDPAGFSLADWITAMRNPDRK